MAWVKSELSPRVVAELTERLVQLPGSQEGMTNYSHVIYVSKFSVSI